MKYCLTLLFCIIPILAFSQNVEGTPLDLLSYEQLLSRFEEVEHDSILAEPIAREYLNRARREGDTIKMARGYDRLARIFHHEKNIAMADSLIALTKDMEHITYPGLGYLLKARNNKSIKSELENLLQSYYYAEKSNNVYHKLHILSQMFTKKSNWGQIDEAYKFLKQNEKILQDPKTVKYIESAIRPEIKSDSMAIKEWRLFNLFNTLDHIDAYIKLEKFDSAQIYINKANKQISDGVIRSGIVLKSLNNLNNIKIKYYQDSIDSALEQLKFLDKNNDHIKNIKPVDFNFFWGMALLKQNNLKKGIQKLIEAEKSILFSRVIPDYKAIYDSILKYNNFENRDDYSYYLTRSMRMDSIINENLKVINPNIIKFVETPKLIAEKQELINDLDGKNKTKTKTLIISLSLLGISLITIGFYYRRNRAYKARFKQLTSNNNILDKSYKNEIPSHVIKNILDELEKFEEINGFIDSNITLHSLAKKFGTNERYLSKVINIKKGKHFPTYLNDLRVDYAVEQCKTNSIFKKFTIKAIAQECGFNSAESFSRAFYRKLKIYPSYYIKNLNKLEPKKSSE
ncbi:helix-turn-helix domain-containing protein [Flavobacteriaceae bacterium TK19130]|nr:helix-turn-helix domain-containing protein [Thermobacterium salinum]